jgi:hypothetical protein
VSVEASCSGLKSEKSRAANYGHYQLLGGNNNVRKQNYGYSPLLLVSNIIPKRLTRHKKRSLLTYHSCSCSHFQNYTNSDNRCDDDPWGRNLFDNITLDEVSRLSQVPEKQNRRNKKIVYYR